MSEGPLAPLTGALRDVMRWLGGTQTRGVVIGGVAVSVLGRPRMTADVDLVVLIDDNPTSFLSRASTYSIVPRIPDVLAFAERTRVLLLRHAQILEDFEKLLPPDFRPKAGLQE